MFLCRHGILSRSVWRLTALACFLLPQARSVFAQGVSMGNDGLLSMAFVEDNFAAGDAREGHATLAWNEVDGAAQYELTAQDATRMYRGVMAQAFVSGLTNGTYEFRAVALNEAGEVIAATRVPATVIVQHWRLRDALALFLCGLIVFVSLIVVMIRGTMASGSGPAAEVRPSQGTAS